jgi:hypothetical protein
MKKFEATTIGKRKGRKKNRVTISFFFVAAAAPSRCS